MPSHSTLPDIGVIAMLRRYILLLNFIIFASCSIPQSSRTNHAEVDPSETYLGRWQLVELDSAAFVAVPSLRRKQAGTPSAVSSVAAVVMIQFSRDGQFTATAGCNRLFGRQERVYPDFNLSPIGSTRMDCPTTAERLFVGALSVMNKAHRDGEILILSNQAGREMTFSRY